MLLLAILPAIAHAPAWMEGRLLGPGDGSALHYPLRAEVWAAWRRGELPAWNPWIFSGTPLLAAYRPGALHPMMVVLAPLPSFAAFQVLVLMSLGATAVLTFIYVRRLGAGTLGGFVSGLAFALGPYLVGHLGDTATIVAAPFLPLLLLACESTIARPDRRGKLALAGALALLLLAGSPEAVRAGGALLLGRLAVGYAMGGGFPIGACLTALASGALLAAPQLVPTLLALSEAGRQVAGLAPSIDVPLPGLAGLALRYVSHTPAPALALAALPLMASLPAARAFGVALCVCLGLQWGRGPLSAPGALALVFDFSLASLAGLSLHAQWNERRTPRGRKLRSLFLMACLLSAVVLSGSAAALGPLPEPLASSVGVLALALIVYFAMAEDADPVKAGVFALPLTVSFLLQPQGRDVWAGAPTRAALEEGSATRQAVDRALAGRRTLDRILTIARDWPKEAADLGYANAGSLVSRRSVNGYDPMVALRSRSAFEGMGPSGLLTGAFLRSDPRRLELLGVRFVQVGASALAARPDPGGLGERLDMALGPSESRFFPLPSAPATSLRLASHLSNALAVRDRALVARVFARLSSGRDLPLELLAGRDTAEWSIERDDVKSVVAHSPAAVLESWDGGGFRAHRYLASLALPGRYFVDGVRIETAAFGGVLTLGRIGFLDEATGRATPVALPSAFVSDVRVFREVLATPTVRLFELPRSLGARVARGVVDVPNDRDVLDTLRAPLRRLDPVREAVAVAGETAELAVQDGAAAARAELVRALGGRLDVRASGPGVLVLAESFDPGWRAEVDGLATPVRRVNHAQIGVPLAPGFHRVELRYAARGFGFGLGLSALGALLITFPIRLTRPA